MSHSQIETERLRLVVATVPLLEAEIESVDALGRALGADVAPTWPPPLNDDESRRWMLAYLRDTPDPGGWGMWYFLLRDAADARPVAIGNGGFKGAPTRDGTVEIGYSIVPNYQRRGLGAEAVRALVRFAFGHPAVRRVIAETYPALRPSIRVLEKNGFRLLESGEEPDVLRFALDRPDS